jgi:hypothetical protein
VYVVVAKDVVETKGVPDGYEWSRESGRDHEASGLHIKQYTEHSSDIYNALGNVFIKRVSYFSRTNAFVQYLGGQAPKRDNENIVILERSMITPKIFEINVPKLVINFDILKNWIDQIIV